MKKIKRIVLGLLATTLLVAIALTILAVVYEEEIEQFALEQIQESLITEVSVGEIDLSVWQKFPQASLVCENVLIHETINREDTLIYAGEIFLQFSIWDIIKGEYEVSTVTIEDGDVSIVRLADGTDNYHFWKTTGEGEAELNFVLDQVFLKNVKAHVEDQKAEFSLTAHVDDVEMRGEFANMVFDMDVNANLVLHEITVGEERYVSEKSVLADFVLQVNDPDKAYYLSEGEFELEEIPFGATGSFMDLADGILCDLDVIGKGLNIEQLCDHLPESTKAVIASYRSKGELDFAGSISGLAGVDSQPDVLAKFTVEDGSFTHFESGIAMSDIRASGIFEKLYGQPEKLTVEQVHADFESGSFSATGVIEEFNQPWINGTIQGHFDLEEFKKFAELDQLEELRGDFSANASFAGKLKPGGIVDNDVLKKATVEGQLQFEGATFRLVGAPHTFESLQGKFTLNNRHATIDRFSGEVENSDFALSGRFDNFLPFLLISDEELNITASFRSNLLDFNPLLSVDDGGEENNYHLVFPSDINFDLDLVIDQLNFREFAAQKIQGKARLKDQILTLDPLALRTAEGAFVADVTVNGQSDDLFTVASNARMQGINITKLFDEFENFGQDFITSSHLKGTATADVKFNAELNSSLDFDQDKVYSLVDITVDNGELIDLKSMRNISAYVRENKMIAPFVDEDALDEKLTHIFFNTLSNQIEVANGKIRVPEMMIASSAMDISAEGEHSFSNAIDYTIGFKIRDVLSKNQTSEFGEVEDDGLSNSFFLSMTGTSDSPEFGYDRLAHKQKRQEDRQKEISKAKQVLKEELGLFKGDNTLQDPDPAQQPIKQGKVTVVVDGEETESVEKKGPKRKWKKLLGNDKEEESSGATTTVDDDDDF